MKTHSTRLITIVSFTLLTIFLLFYSNKDGYEGDDLNSIVPAMHLDEMRDGLIAGYKYDWQPLSYQLCNALFKLTHMPQSMFLISPVSIAISIILLFLIVNRLFGTGFLSFTCLLLLFPEFIYTGLYYNSHAPACLIYVIAMWVLFTTNPDKNVLSSAILTGAITSLSILFRFDYVLAAPMLVIMFYLKTNSLRYSLVLIISATFVGLFALLINVFNLSDLIEIYQTSSQEIHDKALDGGWNRYVKTMALSAMLSPVGWLFFLVGIFLFVLKNQHSNRTRLYLILLATLPMLYPLQDLLSVKYALPLLTWMFLFGAYLLMRLKENVTINFYRMVQFLSLLTSIFLLFIYFNIDNTSPYFNLSIKQLREIPSHDGSRSWGGYFHEYTKIKTVNQKTEGYLKSKELVDQIKISKQSTFLIVGKQNVFEKSSAGWKFVQLFLAEQDNVTSTVIDKNHILIKANTNMVHLCEHVSCLNAKQLADPFLQVIYPDYVNL
jgi:hypothetical protein